MLPSFSVGDGPYISSVSGYMRLVELSSSSLRLDSSILFDSFSGCLSSVVCFCKVCDRGSVFFLDLKVARIKLNYSINNP